MGLQNWFKIAAFSQSLFQMGRKEVHLIGEMMRVQHLWSITLFWTTCFSHNCCDLPAFKGYDKATICHDGSCELLGNYLLCVSHTEETRDGKEVPTSPSGLKVWDSFSSTLTLSCLIMLLWPLVLACLNIYILNYRIFSYFHLVLPLS